MSAIGFLNRLTGAAPGGGSGRRLTVEGTMYLLPEDVVDQIDEVLVQRLAGGPGPFELVRAAAYGLVGVVRRVLARLPVRPPQQDARALEAAATNGYLEVVRVLLAAGVPPTPEAAMRAAKYDHPGCLQLLLGGGGDILTAAASAGSVAVLRFLCLHPPTSGAWAGAVEVGFMRAAQSGDTALAERLSTLAHAPLRAVSLALRCGNAKVLRVLQKELNSLCFALFALKTAAPAVYACQDMRRLILLRYSRLLDTDVAESLAMARRLGHAGAIAALLLHPGRSPPLLLPDSRVTKIDWIVQAAIRSVLPELPGTRIRRLVTDFCLGAFDSGMGVKLCFDITHRPGLDVAVSSVEHEVGLTRKGILWSIAIVHGDCAPTIPTSPLFDHIVEANSFEVGALMTAAERLPCSLFWSTLETTCRAMDYHAMQTSSYVRILESGVHAWAPGPMEGMSFSNASRIDCVEFAEDWRPSAYQFTFGSRRDADGRRAIAIPVNFMDSLRRVSAEIERSPDFQKLAEEEEEEEEEADET
jgi:hypothetical protein